MYDDDDKGNDLLMNSGGRPWAKWKNVGDVVTGTVVGRPTQRQSRDFESGDPDFWPNGDPKMEVVIGIQTDEIDPEIEFDDGTRAVVLPLGTPKFKAVQGAVRKSGAKGIQEGGVLTVTFSAEKKHEKKGYNPIKQFTAEYVPPGMDDADAQAALDALMGDEA